MARACPEMFSDMSEQSTAPGGGRAIATAFDPSCLGRDFYEDPYPTYAALRTFDPVHRCPDGSYFLTRHADLERIYRDRQNFSSDKKSVYAPKFGTGAQLYEHHTSSLVFNDPPYHARVRRQIVGALTPHVLNSMEPAVVSLVDALLDRMEEQRHFDLIRDYAAAIPVEVIGNLLRVPREDRAPLRGWSLAILGALEPVLTPDQHMAGNRAVREFGDYLRILVADRLRHPGDEQDMLTRLLGAGQMTETELLHNCIFLLNAGHETTTNLIGNSLHALITHPGTLQQLRETPQLISTAVEEFLRFESSNQLGNRLVTQRVVIGDVALEPGTYLTLCIGAANRDPDEFAAPDRLDLARSPNRHLAFGAGAHACAGMSVARLEARIAILRAAQRIPGLHLTSAPTRDARARFRGFRSLLAAC
ncbi:MAG: cytochrome [Gammaproteobacteria bacterium]|nr:cytochrome [Gammaproteobacteria bacterium]